MKVVLVEPEIPGNIGAVARIMKNFGFRELILVNPQCDYLSSEAIARAKHGRDVLENARVLNSLEEVKKEVDYLIVTTGKIKSKRIFRKEYMTCEEVAERFYGRNIALVFGRESIGLTNEELLLGDVLSWIPASEDYPILNLSHAVGIYLYEFFKRSLKKIQKVYPNPGKVRRLFDVIEEVISMLPERREGENREMAFLLKTVLSRSNLDENEVDWLFAFFRKIERVIHRK